MKPLLAILLLLPVTTPDVAAHSGGLDSNGCHAGSQPYHCHRSPNEMDGNRLRCDLGSRSKDCGYTFQGQPKVRNQALQDSPSQLTGALSDSEEAGIKGLLLGRKLTEISSEVGFSVDNCTPAETKVGVGTVCVTDRLYTVALEPCKISRLHFWNGGLWESRTWSGNEWEFRVWTGDSWETRPPLDGLLYDASLTCPIGGFGNVLDAMEEKFQIKPSASADGTFAKWVWEFVGNRVVYLSRLGSIETSSSSTYTIRMIDLQTFQAREAFLDKKAREARNSDI